MNQVGQGNVAVVSPSGTYDNMAHPDQNQQFNQDPPEYSVEEEDSVFSDPAIRRGMGGMDGGRNKCERYDILLFFFDWSELNKLKQYLPRLLSMVFLKLI